LHQSLLLLSLLINQITMTNLSPQQRKALGIRAARGEKITVLAREFKVTPKTVYRWRDEARDPRVWTDKQRPGAPRQLDAAQQAKAKRLARGGHKVSQIVPRVISTSNKPVSRSTVARALKDTKFPLRYAKVGHGRSLSAVNKEKRFDWCALHQTDHTGDWLFADSKVVNVYGTDFSPFVYKWWDIDTPPKGESVSNPYTFHFYACVGKNFKSDLVFTAPSPPVGSKARKGKEAFASKHFKEVVTRLHTTIKRHPKYSKRYKLVLDGAKQHVSKASKQMLRRLGVRLLDGFPAQSWDTNIIEHVWGVLRTKLDNMGGRRPTTPDGWRRRINRAWKQIDQRTINLLASKATGRMKKIHEKGGAWLSAKECREC
jgi:transposase